MNIRLLVAGTESAPAGLPVVSDVATIGSPRARLDDGDFNALVTGLNVELPLVIDALAEGEGKPPLDRFIAYVLDAITGALALPSAELWRDDGSPETFCLDRVFRDGANLRPPTRDDVALPTRLRKFYASEALLAIRSPWIADVATSPLFDDQQRSRLAKADIVSVIILPLIAARRTIGAISVRVLLHQEVSLNQLGQAQTLADYVARALQVADLADRARDGQATASRTTALLSANQAMHASLANLTKGADLDGLLSHVLRTIVEQLGEDSAGLWLIDHSGSAWLQISMENGLIKRSSETDHPSREKRNLGRVGSDNHRENNSRLGANAAFFDGPEEMTANLDWFRANGVRGVLSIPLFAGNSLLGSVTIRARYHESFTDEQIAFGQALANQAAVALHVGTLAEHARNAAVAEGRTLSLLRANDAMHTSLGCITDSAELDQMMGQVLKTIVEQLGESSGGVWLQTDESRELILTLENGVLRRARDSQHPATSDPLLKVNTQLHLTMVTLLRGKRAYFHGPEDMESIPDYAPYLSFFRDNGVHGILSLPLFAGDKHLGAITVRAQQHETFSAEDTALAQALANQAALALHISRLATEANAAALAREREIAALNRAERLATANRLLKQSAEAIGAIENIDAFLGDVLLTLTGLVQAHSSTLWLYDANRSVNVLRFVVLDGVLHPAEESGHPDEFSPISTEVPHFWNLGGGATGRSKPFFIPMDSLSEKQRVYLDALGVKALLSVPIVLKDTYLGSYVIRMSNSKEVSSEDLELFEALANQAAVALNMVILAERAQIAAVAEGRAQSLVRANAAMHASLGTITDAAELNEMLGRVLTTIVEELGEKSGTVWLHDDEWRGRLVLILEDGTIKTCGESRHPAGGSQPDLSNVGTADQIRIHRIFKRNVATFDDPEEWEKNPNYKPHIAYLRALGVQGLLNIPLFAGDSFLGTITVRAQTHSSFSAEAIAFAQALANQAALALRISQLATDARDTAVAQARAAELAKANDALQSGLGFLAEDVDIHAYLGHQVRIIADHLQSAAATLWTSDTKECITTLALVYENGEVVEPSSSLHPLATVPQNTHRGSWLNDPFNLQKKPVFITPALYLDRAQPFYDPSVADYLDSVGVRALLAVPLLVGKRVIGSFVFRLASADPIPAQRLELAQALASQTALALHLAQLSDRAKAAAVAEEREVFARERLKVLARANEALRRTSSKLANEPALEAFLGQTLTALVEAFGGCGGTFWRGTIGKPLQPTLELINGVVLPSDQTQHPKFYVDSQSYNEEQTNVELSQQSGEIAVIVLREAPWFGESARSYLLAKGVKTVITVPIMIGDTHLGRLVIRLDTEREVGSDEIELARSLATQAGVAMELTRLAEEGRERAIAQERERAAQLRADKLAESNAALRGAIDTLKTPSDLDGLLGRTLRSMAKQLGVEDGTVWMYQHDTGQLHLRFALDRLALVQGRLSSHPNALEAYPRTRQSDAVIAFHLAHGPSPSVTRVTREEGLTDAQYLYLKALGTKLLINVPMVLNGQYVGSFVLHLREERTPSPEDLSLLQALADQATLAFQLIDLADQAQTAAVARERESAAEARALKLAQANVALRGALEALREPTDLDLFLGRTLRVIADHLGVRSATVWTDAESASERRVRFVIEHGRLLNAADASPFIAQVPYARGDQLERLHARQRNSISSIETETALSGALKDYLSTIGATATLNLPMILGDEHLGTFTLHLIGDQAPASEDLELVQALADQATLAFQLTRLGLQARDAAIAKERQTAIESRAAELALANRTLRVSASNLVSLDSIDDYLGQLIVNAAHAVGARACAIGYAEASREIIKIARAIESMDGNPAPVFVDLPFHDKRKDAWDALESQAEQTWLVEQNDVISHALAADPATTAVAVFPLRQHGEMVGFLALVFDHRERLGLAQAELLRVLAQQATLAIQLSTLASQAQRSAVLEERQRFARELHDGIAQAFLGVILRLQGAEESQSPEAVAEAIGLARHGLAEARRAVAALRPHNLLREILPDAVRRIAEQLTRGAPRVRMESPPVWVPLSSDIEAHLYRIVQEAINNVVKHARAATLSIEISRSDLELSVLVSDDGRGFTMDRDGAGGFGMESMHQRAAIIGAQLNVLSRPGSGTQVYISIMMASAAPREEGSRESGN